MSETGTILFALYYVTWGRELSSRRSLTPPEGANHFHKQHLLCQINTSLFIVFQEVVLGIILTTESLWVTLLLSIKLYEPKHVDKAL